MDSRFSACIEISEIERMRSPNCSMTYAREQATRMLLEQLRPMIKFTSLQNHSRPTVSVFANLDLPEKIVSVQMERPAFKPSPIIKSFYKRLEEEIDGWIRL